ncbi:hypothetical protein [Nannocystis punicea]|uniref:Uncharacterized protein n=1 Tax=Nannocystis punicea TaxID=2995304 RepID=A0ABY7HGI9_9BACT|nr:hypothetical protein [Nannocystis poenicansa]WAS98428.1 hypothetical protein O0S08_19985 [Nannocystis poenicansa]
MLFGECLWEQGALNMAEEAAAWIAFQAGSKGRREWLSRAAQ